MIFQENTRLSLGNSTPELQVKAGIQRISETHKKTWVWADIFPIHFSGPL